MGGFAIYNPAIAKVKVHYDIFKDHQMSHTLHKKATSRVMGDVETMRKQADAIILNIWNEVESYYKDLLPYEKLCHCKNYGVIYYYRPTEKKLSAETDREILRLRESQPTIDFGESPSWE